MYAKIYQYNLLSILFVVDFRADHLEPDDQLGTCALEKTDSCSQNSLVACGSWFRVEAF